MNFLHRVARHVRIVGKTFRAESPDVPFVVLFINSICNLTCEHCFYWRNLNRKDDLTFDEMKSLSRQMGRIENLNLSGGEPFLRPEFAEICSLFIRNNQVEQIYVPTNAYFTDRTIKQLEMVFQEPSLKLMALEISLDGMPEYHDRFRGNPKSFEKAMQTYDALAEFQKKEPRLRIHSISTATSENMGEIEQLTEYLFERCPAMDHHNIALIRGDRKNPSLQGPDLDRYLKLVRRVKELWKGREEDRFGSVVEPMLQWAKVKTARERRQVIPCKAGVLSAVIYSNGDVSFCENHPPIGSLREQSFPEIWKSIAARDLRQSVSNKECHCTNEIFMWPSIVFQPAQLARAYVNSRRPTA